MKLSDFYFEEKALVGKKMPILLPNGEDSGEWLNVVSPDADAAVKAGRAFIIAYRRGLARFEELEKPPKKPATILNITWRLMNWRKTSTDNSRQKS